MSEDYQYIMAILQDCAFGIRTAADLRNVQTDEPMNKAVADALYDVADAIESALLRPEIKDAKDTTT